MEQSALGRPIEVTNEPFGAGFYVKIVPPIADDPLDAEFADYRKARAWAEGLHRTRGWRILDSTGQASA